MVFNPVLEALPDLYPPPVVPAPPATVPDPDLPDLVPDPEPAVDDPDPLADPEREHVAR